MFTIKKPIPHVFHVEVPNIFTGATTFIRFQEHYEGKGDFYRNPFSLEEIMDHIYEEEKEFTYFTSSYGFNVPFKYIKTVIETFPDLTKKEKLVYDLLVESGIQEDDYVICTEDGDDETYDHELAHAKFHTDIDYQKRATVFVESLEVVDELLEELSDMGYRETVLIDEAQAYILGGGYEDINISEETITYLEMVRNEFEKDKRLSKRIFSKGNLSEGKKSPFENALELATQAHEGQFRRGSGQPLPFVTHPISVSEIVVKLSKQYSTGVDVETLKTSAVLHDTVEDTHVTVKDINKLFGRKIASIVELLTNNPKKDYIKFVDNIIASNNKGAMLVKLADITHNMSTGKGVIKGAKFELWQQSKDKLENALK